ncbi:putative macrophage mannose receptor 1 [Apostichopus japonicus]|uniref:Putative macrophage mannose receptor 1 n=1 Tax=Stichopus japonicus TaxID=307972 RepID=A0A2G8KPT9_STIJA|nr:putative macrophage mannose receptor 1 [Apostichopus japonicus]
MRLEKLSFLLLTVIVMAEAKVCYKYHRFVNGSFDCVNGTRNATTPCTSYRLGGVSLGQATATGGALTNGNTSPSSSKQSQDVSTTDVSLSTAEPVETTAEPVETTAEPVETTAEPVETTAEPVETTAEPVETTAEPVETTKEPVETTKEPVETTAYRNVFDVPSKRLPEAQSDSTTDVTPSITEAAETTPRCNSLIADLKYYDMAKNACREIGGEMFGFEHVQQPNKTAEEIFLDLMNTHTKSSSCDRVWVDIIRGTNNQFKWSEGRDFNLSSWWGLGEPNNDGGSENCVIGWLQGTNWKLNDLSCTENQCCTMCMESLCHSDPLTV